MDDKRIFNKRFKRVVQFELNELSIDVIQKIIARDKLPHFKQINQDWFQLYTDSEKKYEILEPWIQWTTAHTGKFYKDHKIFHLGDALNLQHPQLWEVLSEQDMESCIMGGMNAVRGTAKGGFFFPDPWSKAGVTYPENIQPLWNLISAKVQTHKTGTITLDDLWQGFKICRGFNLPFSLYMRIAKQLLINRVNKSTKWKMPGLFDQLLLDIFKHLLSHSQSRYFSLFLNSCAHYQHHYWRNFEPELFSSTISSSGCKSSHDPVTYGYTLYDGIVEYALELAKDPDTLVVIATGLSQVPFLDREQDGGMNYYRLYNHAQLLRVLGLEQCKALPMMSRDWQVESNSQMVLTHALSVLSGLAVNNMPLFKVRQNTSTTLFIETAYTAGVAQNAEIKTREGVTIGRFSQYLSRIAVKSGHHIGQGVLWLSQPPARFSRGQVIPLTELFAIGLDALCEHVPAKYQVSTKPTADVISLAAVQEG